MVALLIVAVLELEPLFWGEYTAIPLLSGLALLRVMLNKVPFVSVPEIALPLSKVPEN